MNFFFTLKTSFILSVISIILISCGGRDKRRFKKTPIDNLIVKYNPNNNYSIILQDMDFDEQADAYKHQYQILYQPNNLDTLLEDITEWMVVTDELFDKHKDNLGMTIVNRINGELTKVASPPGYAQYVGNEKYGQWSKRSDGSSFWEFYGKYAFMSNLFRMVIFPVRYSYWNDYYSGGYYGRKAYYGPSGKRVYGTGSIHSKTNSKSTWNSKSNNFKQRVRNKVSKSVASKKKSRSSSRYRSSSSSRSRSGGFGK